MLIHKFFAMFNILKGEVKSGELRFSSETDKLQRAKHRYIDLERSSAAGEELIKYVWEMGSHAYPVRFTQSVGISDFSTFGGLKASEMSLCFPAYTNTTKAPLRRIWICP